MYIIIIVFIITQFHQISQVLFQILRNIDIHYRTVKYQIRNKLLHLKQKQNMKQQKKINPKNIKNKYQKLLFHNKITKIKMKKVNRKIQILKNRDNQEIN